MPAIAFGMLWAAWAGGLYGWCLVRGYDVSFVQLVNPVHPYRGPWPPPPASNTVILPSGGKGDQAAPAAPGPAAKPQPGKCPPGYLWDGSRCLQGLP